MSGSVEAACALGLADAVIDLVETGTTMMVKSNILNYFNDTLTCTDYYYMALGCWFRSSTRNSTNSSHPNIIENFKASRNGNYNKKKNSRLLNRHFVRISMNCMLLSIKLSFHAL